LDTLQNTRHYEVSLKLSAKLMINEGVLRLEAERQFNLNAIHKERKTRRLQYPSL